MRITILLMCVLAVPGYSQIQPQLFKKSQQVGIIDKVTGDTIIPAQYDDVNDYSDDGYFSVTNGGKMGVVDTMNRVVIPIKYPVCSTIWQDRLFVGDGNKLALMDKSGKLLTGYIYESTGVITDCICRVKIGGKFGYIDINGKNIVPCKYLSGSDPLQGLVVVKTDKWEDLGTYKVTKYRKSQNVNVGYTQTYSTVYNKLGKVVYQGEGNEEITVLPNSRILTSLYHSDYGRTFSQLMDHTGKVLYPYSNQCELTDGGDCFIAKDQENYKYGVIDLNGSELLKPIYYNITPQTIDDVRYWRVYTQSKEFFYIAPDGKCVELQGVKCPTE